MQRRGSFKLLQPKSGNGVEGGGGTRNSDKAGDKALTQTWLSHPPFPGDHLKLREIKDQPRITQQSHNRARIYIPLSEPKGG